MSSTLLTFRRIGAVEAYLSGRRTRKNTEAHNQTYILTAHNPEVAVCPFVMEIGIFKRCDFECSSDGNSTPAATTNNNEIGPELLTFGIRSCREMPGSSNQVGSAVSEVHMTHCAGKLTRNEQAAIAGLSFSRT
jgi:hypothetical protein